MDCKYCGHSAVGLTDTCGDCWHTWINEEWHPSKKPPSQASREWPPARSGATGALAPQRTAVALRQPPVGVA